MRYILLLLILTGQLLNGQSQHLSKSDSTKLENYSHPRYGPPNYGLGEIPNGHVYYGKHNALILRGGYIRHRAGNMYQLDLFQSAKPNREISTSSTIGKTYGVAVGKFNNNTYIAPSIGGEIGSVFLIMLKQDLVYFQGNKSSTLVYRPSAGLSLMSHLNILYAYNIHLYRNDFPKLKHQLTLSFGFTILSKKFRAWSVGHNSPLILLDYPYKS